MTESKGPNHTRWRSVYGSVIIDCKLYTDSIIEWTFKVFSTQFLDECKYFTVGILAVHETNEEQLEGYCFNSNSECRYYAWSSNTGSRTLGLEHSIDDDNVEKVEVEHPEFVGFETGKDNIIKMYVNIKK